MVQDKKLKGKIVALLEEIQGPYSDRAITPTKMTLINLEVASKITEEIIYPIIKRVVEESPTGEVTLSTEVDNDRVTFTIEETVWMNIYKQVIKSREGGHELAKKTALLGLESFREEFGGQHENA